MSEITTEARIIEFRITKSRHRLAFINVLTKKETEMATKFHNIGHMEVDGNELAIYINDIPGCRFITRETERGEYTFTEILNEDSNRVGYLKKCRPDAKPDFIITWLNGNLSYTCFPDEDGGWNITFPYEVEDRQQTQTKSPW